MFMPGVPLVPTPLQGGDVVVSGVSAGERRDANRILVVARIVVAVYFAESLSVGVTAGADTDLERADRFVP